MNEFVIDKRQQAIRSALYTVLLVINPLALWLAWKLREHPHRRWLAMTSIAWLVVMGALWPQELTVTNVSLYVWGAGVGLFGLWIYVVVIWEWAMATLQDWLNEHNRPIKGAEGRSNGEAPKLTGGVVLGTLQQTGSNFEDWMGVRHLNGWVGVTMQLLTEHTLIVGSSGTGKTTTIYQIVDQIASTTDWDIFVVDGKGEPKFAYDIANIIYRHRKRPVPLFMLGHAEPGSVYDSLRGNPQAVFNRLAELLGIDKMTGDDSHYGRLYEVMLRLVCEAPGGPPRSLEQLSSRLSFQWLREKYKGNFGIEHKIQLLESFAKDLTGLYNRATSLLLAFDRHMGPEGFSLENCGSAVFSIVKLSVGFDAERFLGFFLQELGDGITMRRTRPAVLIIDEFGVFGGERIKPLLMTGRSRDFGIILATQTATSLGDLDSRKEYLELCNTLFLMNANLPNELVELAGMVQRLETSIRQQDGQLTGDGTAYTRKQYRINPDDVRSLKPGEGFLMRKNSSWKLKVPEMKRITHDQQAIITHAKAVPVQAVVNDTPRPEF